MRLPVTLPAVLGLSLLGPLPASAQEPFGGEFKVNTFTTGDQTYPQLAADAVGNFVIAWNGATAAGSGIVAQRFDATGARRGGEFLVSSGQGLVRLTGDPAGNFMVAWTSAASPGQLLVQRFDAAGQRRGEELQLLAPGPASLGSNASGRFVVVWEAGGIRGQRYDAGGNPLGGPFQANTYTQAVLYAPRVAVDDAGGFVVTWNSGNQQGIPGVFSQHYDVAGARRGQEQRVTPLEARSAGGGVVAAAPAGHSIVAYSQLLNQFVTIVFGRLYGADGTPSGDAFRLSGDTAGEFNQLPISVAAMATGGFASAWRTVTSFNPPVETALVRRFGTTGAGGVQTIEEFPRGGIRAPVVTADGSGNLVTAFDAPAESGRDAFARRFGQAGGVSVVVDATGNRVFEPGETVSVQPSWRNFGAGPLGLDGSVFGFDGPPGAEYGVVDGSAGYGSIAGGASAECSDCYRLSISNPATRPTAHWDATMRETTSPASQAQEKAWTLHVGRSFADVPPASPYYRFVETLFHRGVAGGAAGQYLPASVATRAQMAVFVLAAREGAGWAPRPCPPPGLFADVPHTSPYCRWIEELARRGVVSGCGGSNYCPEGGVTRAQMAVFLLRTLDGALDPPACEAPNLFADVPETDPFCRWIEELARRGVTGGCADGLYCPERVVTREQMAVFVTVTFGLTLYGPY